MQRSTGYIGLGSNIGNRLSLLKKAIQELNNNAGVVLHQSKVYETPPWGFDADQSFYNQVVELHTKLSPEELLDVLQRIEKILGRVRDGKGYASRTMDLDILFFNQEIMNTERLKIPHPKLHERNFVLVPMNEIAPQLVHPQLKRTISELLGQSPDQATCKPIEENH